MSYPEDQPVLNSRMVIDACRPWIKRDTFPAVARSSAGLDARIREKFAHVLPKGA
jgi:4-hydroxy-3-polyprenylbenzoate decarboxylase